MLRNMQRLDGAVYLRLLLPVDQQFGTRAGNAADIMSALQLEQERFVGHSGFQTADIVDFRLRHFKNLRNQLQRGIIRMILVAGIKLAQLLQIFKFINLMLRLPVDIHLQRI